MDRIFLFKAMKTTGPVLYKFAQCITYFPSPAQDLTLIIFYTASKRLIVFGRIVQSMVFISRLLARI